MKILGILNVSNVDDLAGDSGVACQRILAAEFKKSDIDYLLVVPDIQQFRDLQIEGARKAYLNMGVNRYDSRFNFDWDGMKQLIEHERPNLIYNNQIELTSAIRSVVVALGLSQTKIVAYCHYPALWPSSEEKPLIDASLDIGGLGLSVVLDILAAVQVADATIIQSRFAKNLLLHAAEYHRIDLTKEIFVIPPPIDPMMLGEGEPSLPENRKVVYNHRLYATYGTAEFIDFVQRLENIQLVVTDPMANRSEKRNSLSASPAAFRQLIRSLPQAQLFDGGKSRIYYRSLLKGARVGVGAFRKACVWSMSAIDCIGLGIPVIAPRYAAYPELIPDQLLFDDEQQAIEITHRLLNDDEFWRESITKSQSILPDLMPERIAKRIIDIFKNGVQQHYSK